MTKTLIALLTAFLGGGLLSAAALAEEVKVDLVLGWEDEVSGARGGLETAVFPRLVIGDGRIIVTTAPSMAPSPVRDRLAECGRNTSIEQFMACRRSAGVIVAPPQNAAVIFPGTGGTFRCSSTQVLNEKSYRICASVQMQDARHLQVAYALEGRDGNTVVTRKTDIKVELDKGKCVAELISAQRNYSSFPGRVFSMTRPTRPVCNYSF